MLRPSVVRHLAASVLFVFVIVSSAFAAPAKVFEAPIRRALQQMPANGSTTLRNISLGRASLDSIEIEPMEVWAKDAKVVVYGASGEQTVIPPPAVKYFKGRVIGEDESAVFFSMSADGSIRGMVLIGERRWNIGSGVIKAGRVKNREADFTPTLISEIEPIDDLTDAASNWECHVDRHGTSTLKLNLSALTARAGLEPVSNAGGVAGATYQLRIAVETDDELCAAFGNNSTTITTYIGDLIGKASTIYSRDLKTTLVIGQTNIRNGGAGTDPWTATTAQGTGAALAEFGTYWHNNYSMASFPRSSAVFLSGRLFSGGIAWSYNTLCTDDFFCLADGSQCGGATYANAWAGAYAFNGSAGSVEASVPDPEATVNGVQYGLPAANYWMLLQFMHELGHNAQGPHTQCMALTAQEKIDFNTSRNFVDECYNRDGTGCYGGTTANCNLSNPGDPYCDAPPEKGTIMSYCHNIFSSGFRQSRYLFGKAGEPSSKVLTTFNTALEAATPNPTITGQAEPVACSAGRTASVTACTGCTYAWQITGGAITGSTTGSSITYTPSAASVTLTVTVITARGCGITASKTISTSCGAVNPPTNVVATATSGTSVTVSWTNASGATSYNVYRSTNGTFSGTPLGSSASTPFVDSTAVANTAYMYKVRSVQTAVESTDSNRDFAVTMVYTDPTVNAQSTTIKAAHVSELRTAVNGLRTLNAGQANFSFTDPTLNTSVTCQAVHIDQLRAELNTVRTALGFLTVTFTTDPTLTATSTLLKKAHIDELRAAVQ